MSDKKKLVEMKECGLTYDAGVLLGKLAEGLRAGRLTCDAGDPPLDLPLPNEIKLELSIKEKSKDGGVKRKIEIELEWVEKPGE